jgi:hypothetical protein
MFPAIDRVSKFTVVELHQSAGKMEGAAFLRYVAATFPYTLHTVLTNNGMAFADLPKTVTDILRWRRYSAAITSTASARSAGSNIG